MEGRKVGGGTSYRLLTLTASLTISGSLALAACGSLPDQLPFLNPTSSAGTTSTDEQTSFVPTPDSEPAPIDLSPKTGEGMEHGLAYDCLTPAQRGAYDQILTSIRAAQDDFTINLQLSDVETSYYAVRDDHPELFWMEGYTYYDYGDHIRVEPDYAFDPASIETLSARIDELCDPIVDEVASRETTYEQVKAIYEWVINNTEYVASDHDQNILGVFLDQRAVCAGYARAFEHLCRRLRIPCGIVDGTTFDGEDHSWCLVTIDGVPTYVDVTWGDPFFEDDTGESPGVLSYNYLCLTSEEILRDRSITRPADGLPWCDSHEYDFYVLKGCYAEDWEGAGYYLGSFVDDAIARGEGSVAVKFAREEDYWAAYAYVESGELWYTSISEVAWQYSYSTNDVLRIIEVSWA